MGVLKIQLGFYRPCEMGTFYMIRRIRMGRQSFLTPHLREESNSLEFPRQILFLDVLTLQREVVSSVKERRKRGEQSLFSFSGNRISLNMEQSALMKQLFPSSISEILLLFIHVVRERTRSVIAPQKRYLNFVRNAALYERRGDSGL